jgi:uncharacterized protein YggE
MTSPAIIMTIALAAALAPAAAEVQRPPPRSDDREPATIRVVGEATVSAKPDQVEVDIGVTTQRPESEQAASRNAEHVTLVVQALKSRLGAGTAIETISYSLSPDYRPRENGAAPTITAYTATNIVRVTLNDLERVGVAIDAATNAGANRIHRVHLRLKNRDAVHAQALSQAATRAKSEAAALASALGVRIARIVAVRETEPMVRPFQDVMMRAEASVAPPPIYSGAIEVHATVSLTVEIAGGGTKAAR